MRISDWSSDVCSSDLLVHPPFWWYAWGVGLWAYGRPLAPETFALALWVIIGGYVLQRLIEGAFLQWYGMHIHVWEKLDSDFRLITARRNPNLVKIGRASCRERVCQYV